MRIWIIKKAALKAAFFIGLFFLFDFVEFFVDFKKIFFGESNSGHAHKSGKTKEGKAAHHLHHCFFVNVKTAGTFSASESFHNFFEETKENEFSAEGFHNFAHFVVEGKSAFGSIDIEPVEDRAFFFKDVIFVHGIDFSDFAFVFEFTGNSNKFGFANVGNIEIEEMFGAGFLSEAFAVCEEFRDN